MDNDNQEEINKEGFDDFEIIENQDNHLPQNSILLKEDNEKNNENEEIFQSVVFTKMVSEYKNILKQKAENTLKDKLKGIINCGACNKNLQDLFCCPFCKKCSCKKCFNKHTFYLKKDRTPCPICKKMVKRAYLRPNNTLLKAISEVMEEDEDDNPIPLIKFNSEDFTPFCEKHKKNKVWAYCIDCDKKMCPFCFNNENHSNHRCINYGKYLELNVFFGNSFKKMKDFILESEKTIKDLQKLNSELENHKSCFSQFKSDIMDIMDKVNSIFNEGQEKINEIISSLTQKISEFNNFRRNIKKYVTKNIPTGYSDFENMDEIKEEINERIKKIKIDYCPKNDIINIEKNYKNNINFSKLEEKFNINKERIKNEIHRTIQNNENYHFNVELSPDNEEVYFYLNINNNINGKKNDNSYLVKVTVFDMNNNSKTIYLERDKDKENNDDTSTYINYISRKEMLSSFKKGYILVKIFYLELD